MARKPWDHNGKTRDQRGYGRQHVKLREQMLEAEPLCRMCKAKSRVTVATIADHIQPIASGGAVHSLDNMQPLCRMCHDEKTLADQGKRSRPQFGEDGWPL